MKITANAILFLAVFAVPFFAYADYSVVDYVRTPSDITTVANQFDEVYYYDYFNFSGEVIDTPWDYGLFSLYDVDENLIESTCVSRVEGVFSFDLNWQLQVDQYYTFQVALYQEDTCETPATITDTETVVIEQAGELEFAFEVVPPEDVAGVATTTIVYDPSQTLFNGFLLMMISFAFVAFYFKTNSLTR